VAQVYQGDVFAGETYRNVVNTAQLKSGVYTVRIQSLNHADFRRLIVTK
jgi:hypothetical protein